MANSIKLEYIARNLWKNAALKYYCKWEEMKKLMF